MCSVEEFFYRRAWMYGRYEVTVLSYLVLSEEMREIEVDRILVGHWCVFPVT